MDNNSYIIKIIEPSLFDSISKIEILPINEIISKTKEPASIKLQKGSKRIIVKNKNDTEERKVDYKILSHYFILPMMIYLANIRQIENNGFDKNTICEMEALVKASKNNYAKQYKWLYESINTLNKIDKFYVIQYYYNQIDKNNPINFIHQSTEEKEKSFKIPNVLSLEHLQNMCMVAKEVGSCNMFLISEVEYNKIEK